MPEWKPGKTPTKVIDLFEVFYLTSKTSGEGGHEIRFPDGRSIRVLPDLTTSGQKRSRTITEALTGLYETDAVVLGNGTVWVVDPVAYLYGALIVAGCTDVELVDPHSPVVCEACGQALPGEQQ